MNELPPPLTPSDCDLRDFQFMPLDVGRLRDSKLVSHVPPAQCFFAVILWCASWHQVPAASLPDDDIELARLAGFGFVVKEWKKVKDGALYGWIKCADGRLYHPVVAEKARDAWQAKHEQRWRSECGRIKKHNQRHNTSIPYPTFDEFMSPNYVDPTKGDERGLSPGTNEVSPGVVPELSPEMSPGTKGTRDSKGKGQGQGYKEKHMSGKPDDIPPGFAEFWEVWPKSDRKVAKADCLKKWKAKGLENIAERIVEHVEACKQTRKWLDGYEPAPLTYINQQRWLDGDPEGRQGDEANPFG